MKEIIILSLIIAGIYVSYYLRQRLISKQASDNFPDDQAPEKQASGNKPSEFRSINNKQKLELSWQAIKDFAEHVIKNFSHADQQKLLGLGRIMLQHGMKYIHVVDYVLPNKNFVKGQDKDAQQLQNNQSIGR